MVFGKGINNPCYGKGPCELNRRINSQRMKKDNPVRYRNMSNENHHFWKGYDPITRPALHRWIRRHLPEPKLCQVCNLLPAYDLANITGVYNRDFSNWEYQCRRCHMLIDGRMYNLRHQVA